MKAPNFKHSQPDLKCCANCKYFNPNLGDSECKKYLADHSTDRYQFNLKVTDTSVCDSFQTRQLNSWKGK